MPRRARQMARKIGTTIENLERRTGTRPDDETIAQALDVSVDEYRTNLEHLVHVTVGALDETDDGATALRAESTSPEVEASRFEALRRVKGALPRLEERDILVLSLYYVEELTYAEIGQVLGVTTARVCQLHGRAIARLRTEIEHIETKEAA